MNRLIITPGSFGYIGTRALSHCMWKPYTNALIIMNKDVEGDRFFDLMCKYGRDVTGRLITLDNHSTLRFIRPHELDRDNSKYHTAYISGLLTDFKESDMIHICKNLQADRVNIYAQSNINPNPHRNGHLIKILEYLEFII